MIERYKNKQIQEIWAPNAVYRRWFEVEVAHVREIAGAAVANALQEVRPPSPAQVNYYERETGHDVAAFLRGLDVNIQAVQHREGKISGDLPDAVWNRVRSSLHYGLTSSDIVDTALALGLQRSGPVVSDLASKLVNELAQWAEGLRSEVTVGRTHGQLAAPMGAGHRWQVLAQMVDRAHSRTWSAFEHADIGKLSGPVGAGGETEDEALETLGLRSTLATQAVPRDWLAHLAHCLAELVTVCEAVVTQIWLLNQQGIGEVMLTVAFEVGSSAMPHKRNPVLAENVRGLARMARTRAEELQLGIVQWGEHDLAHSSVERVAIPDLLHLTCTVLHRTTLLVNEALWVTPVLPEDYQDTNDMLLALQSQGVPYVEAHAQLTALYRDGKISSTTAGTKEDK